MNDINRSNTHEKAGRLNDHQSHDFAAASRFRRIAYHQCPYTTPLSDRLGGAHMRTQVGFVEAGELSSICPVYAAVKVRSVISEGAPKRLGGPQ